MNKKLQHIASAIAFAGFVFLAVSSTDTCVGDESCLPQIEDKTSRMMSAGKSIRYVGDGTFHVNWITDFGERELTSYETDCNCKVIYIDGRKVD